ncbi:MAG: sodium:solute symporter family protein [Lachnospiraceae bacterium]|nr:sodium:solute symporter family protein [Lachnospiraceae bacterium]
MLNSSQSTFFIAVFILYIALMIFVGWFFTRKQNNGSDFLTGGRRMPMFLVVCTSCATLIGTGSAMGSTGEGYSIGLAGAGYTFGSTFALLILAFAIAPMRKYNFITTAEEAQFYFAGDKRVRKITAVLTLLAEICFMASHMTGGAKYLQFITNMDPTLCKFICLLAFTIYVYIGGYMAVVWTDVIQFSIILVGFVLITLRIGSHVTGWGQITDTFIAAGQPESTVLFGFGYGGTVLAAVTLLITACLSEMGASTFRHRIYTAKDADTARKSFIHTAIITTIFSFIPLTLGMCTRVIATNNGVDFLSNRDFAFPYLCTTVLGPVFGLLLMVAGLSATMSSGDSDAMAGVTIFMKDVIPEFTGKPVPEDRVKKNSRIALVTFLVLAFFLTLIATTFMSFVTNVFGSLMPALVVTTLVGRFWKKVTPDAGVAAMIGGTIFGIIYLAVPSVNAWIVNVFTGPVIPVSLLTLALLVGVSLCTKRPKLSEKEILDIVLSERTDL